jgi:hypothetical protein
MVDYPFEGDNDMKSRKTRAQISGAILLCVGFFAVPLATAQTVAPPNIPPPLLPKPRQPLSLSASNQVEVEAEESKSEHEEPSRPRLVAGPGPWRQKKVSLNLLDAPVEEALTSVAKQAGIGDILYVTNAEPSPALSASPAPAPKSGSDLQLRLPGLGVSVQVNAEDSDSISEEPGAPRTRSRPWNKRHKNTDRVLLGKTAHVEAGESVGDVVSVGGSVIVAGHVTGDAVSVGGSLIVEPSGVVEGDAVVIAGTLEVQPGGQVQGDQVTVGGPFFGKDEEEPQSTWANEWLLPGMAGAFTVFGILAALLRAAVMFVGALLALYLAPRRVEMVRRYLVANPGFSFGGGLLVYGLGPLLMLVFVVTLIGIPLALLLIVAMFLCAVLGMASLLVWLGERIPYFRGKSPFMALLVGALILACLSAIPFFGFALQVVVTLAASGAALLTRLGSQPDL